MPKTAVIYTSVHHGNTKILVEGIAKQLPMDLFTPGQGEKTDLSLYDAVGFASGIYFSKFHESLLSLLEKPLSLPSKAFLLYTSGSGGNYSAGFAKKLNALGIQVLGYYGCKGYDTYGPWKLVGGIAKGHPNQKDIDAGTAFVERHIFPTLD